MRILGIDPGTNILGFAVLEEKEDKLHVLTMDVLRMSKYDDHQDKLHRIFVGVQEIIDTYQPKFMAIEAPFYGKNVQSMLKLGRAQGVAIAAALQRKIDVKEYSPKKIKLAVTGNGNASKEQVSAMMSHLIENRIRHDLLDATDALAAAICHLYQNKRVELMGGQYKDWGSFIKANPNRKA
jgi:crossover junction endodeoxyribonuclease RuvC